MSDQPLSGGAAGGRRLPSRPVSRPPRIRPTTGPGLDGAIPPPVGGRPGRLLRTASGALLALTAVVLGIVLLQAVRGGSAEDEVVLATEQGPAAGSEADASGVQATSESPGATLSAPPTDEPATAAQPPAEVPPATGAQPAPAEGSPGPAAPPVPTDVTVSVLGVGGPDGVEGTADQLRAGGWVVRLVATYRGDPPGATTVFHVPGREQAAGLLAAQVAAEAVRPAPASLSDSDLTLVVG